MQHGDAERSIHLVSCVADRAAYLRHPTYVFSETTFPSHPGAFVVTISITWNGRLLAFAFATFLVQPGVAQTSLEGMWTAHFLTPAGEIASTTYEVAWLGNHLQAETEFAGQRLVLTGYKVEGDRLSFSMDTGFLMDCRLDLHSQGQYKGSCVDSMGNVGPAVIAPPGVHVEPADLDINEAFAVWGISRDEYERERAARRAKPKTFKLPEPEPVPSHMVDVGGYRLNVVDLGSGDVPVILESGIGDDHKMWRAVQEEVAKHTRVVSYDRAGLGRSEASEEPRSPEGIALELRTLLDASGLKPPYVLVGHKAGAFMVRGFQALYPGDVAGLVLVDPSHEDEDEMWNELKPGSWEEYSSKRRTFYSMISDAATREFDAFTRVIESDAAPSPPTASNAPVIVLSGQHPSDSPRWVGETAEGLKAKARLHRALADELHGMYEASTESGSYIQLEDPALVVEAIETILDAVEK